MIPFNRRSIMIYAALFATLSLSSCSKKTVEKTVPDVASSQNSECYAINLNTPESPASIVQLQKTDEKLTINVHSDNKVCIELSGALDGGIVLHNQKNVDIDMRLKDIQITSEKHAGYLELKSNDKNIGNTYRVELIGHSVITGATEKKSKSVISSTPNLVFTGDGSLSVVAKYKNGIISDDVVSIESGNIDIKLDRTEASKKEKYNEKGFGIKADNGFEMSGGKLTIDAADSITGYESRGIKVDGSDKTAYNTGKGYVKISGGELTIRSDAKALSAGWDIDEDAKTETTSDDPHPDVMISGGIIHITTLAEPRGGRKFGPPPEMKFDENGNPVFPDFRMPPKMKDGKGMPPEMAKDNADGGFKRRPSPNKRKDKKKSGSDDGQTTVSPEGIEAKRNLIISGGKISVVAMDDALNAKESITISGGEIMAWSQTNDALDSNGTAMISGGLTALYGAEDPDGALDADMNRNVSYTGGTLVAVGGANNAPESKETRGTFAQVTIVESKHGFPQMNPGMKPQDFGKLNAEQAGGDGAVPSAPNMAAGGDPFNRKREISEIAGATLSLADAETSQTIVSVKVPEKFTGGGSILVLSDALQKDKSYRVYTNPTFAQPITTWQLDVISTSQVGVSGEKFSEVKAGVALPSHFGPMPPENKAAGNPAK